jgi:hypothetical protein
MTSTSRFADRLRTAAATSISARTPLRRRLMKDPETPAPATSLDVQGGEQFAERLRAALSDRPRRTRAGARG